VYIDKFQLGLGSSAMVMKEEKLPSKSRFLFSSSQVQKQRIVLKKRPGYVPGYHRVLRWNWNGTRAISSQVQRNKKQETL